MRVAKELERSHLVPRFRHHHNLQSVPSKYGVAGENTHNDQARQSHTLQSVCSSHCPVVVANKEAQGSLSRSQKENQNVRRNNKKNLCAGHGVKEFLGEDNTMA